jgi:hypothetical protein
LFLQKDENHFEDLFIEVELEKARDYQRYFPKYKKSSEKEHQHYYFKLQRWIKFLNDKQKGTLKIEVDAGEKNKIESKAILINNEVIDKLASLLSGYFHKDRQSDLHQLLRGAEIGNKLIFEGQQNQLCELFLRLHYNSFISNDKTVTSKWICGNFSYVQNGNVKEFNFDTVYNVLTNRKGEVAKKNRLFEADWLPYKKKS